MSGVIPALWNDILKDICVGLTLINVPVIMKDMFVLPGLGIDRLNVELLLVQLSFVVLFFCVLFYMHFFHLLYL